MHQTITIVKLLAFVIYLAIITADNSHVPTMAEMLLPWKRSAEDEPISEPRQAEYPSWAVNEDYNPTDSPSNTYLRKENTSSTKTISD